MLNQCILVGKVISINKENKDIIITLSISHNYKEPGEEEYSVDEIDVQLSNHLSETALEYLNENATVGVKARIAQRNLTVGETTIKVHAIIAEKLTFINTKKQEE
ncbi:MAG: Single-strand binding protein family protein [Candidatus Izimaplasma bacterium HR2]|nr:MAG: Single-strand binding protein family protein [Candidatus Izimaplasma bacterium HR2]